MYIGSILLELGTERVMENKRIKIAMVLAHLGGLIVVATLLAGVLPFFYQRGIVYFGFGWIKVGILAVGLAIAAFGLISRFKKPAKK